MKAFNRNPATLRQDRGCGLPDELVKREVVHHPSKPFAPRFDVGDKDVGSDCESPKEGSGKVKT